MAEERRRRPRPEPVPERNLDPSRLATNRRPYDTILIGALIRGMSLVSAAELVGVSKRTVQRRLSDPVFVAELEQTRGNLLALIAEDVVVGALEGVAVLRKIAKDDQQPAAARVTAASRLTELALGTRYEIDVAAKPASATGPDTPAAKMRALLERVARNQTAVPMMIEATAVDTTGGDDGDADHPEAPLDQEATETGPGGGTPLVGVAGGTLTPDALWPDTDEDDEDEG